MTSNIPQWVEDCIEDTAKSLDIPHHNLDYKQYTDHATQKEVLQIWFRSDGVGQGPGNKYGFEVVHDGSSTAQPIVEDQIERSLRQAEVEYHEVEDNVTFYKGHSFFWRARWSSPAKDLEWFIEVKCTACEYIESVTYGAEEIHYRHDLYLIWLIKRCHENCDCPEDRWEDNADEMNERLLDEQDLALAEGQRFPRST